MISADLIGKIASEHNVDPGIVEKDYVLSKTLMALSQIDLFNQNLLFKGATALKKCYYPDWRFSEDIDLTATKPLEPGKIKAIFQGTVDEVDSLFGLSMRVMEYSQYPKNVEEPITASLKLGYDGPLRKSSGQKNNIRVDIAFDEVVVSVPITKPILTSYTDDIEAQVRLYSLEEIMAEKLRSILQRGKSRDYYDVWLLFKDFVEDFDCEYTRDILYEKCEFKQIPRPQPDEFFDPARLAEAERFWERGLAHQLNALPAFSEVIAALRKQLKKTLEL